jgi:hypothetical protein
MRKERTIDGVVFIVVMLAKLKSDLIWLRDRNENATFFG